MEALRHPDVGVCCTPTDRYLMRKLYTTCVLGLLAAGAHAQITFSAFGPTSQFSVGVEVGTSGSVYVSNAAGNTLSILSSTGSPTGTVTLTAASYGMDLSSTGDLYVALANGSIQRVTGLPGSPSSTAFGTTAGAGTLYDVEFAPPPAGATCTTFPNGTVLYASKSTGTATSTIRYFNANGTECGAITATATNLLNPSGMAYAPALNSLLVAEGYEQRVTRVNLTTGALSTFYSTGATASSLSDIVVSAPPTQIATCTNTFGGKVAYVADDTNNLVRLLDAAGAQCGSITTPGTAGPVGIALNSAGRLFLTNLEGNTLFATDQNLPVELVAFTATTDGDRVTLRWTTASETNNAAFHVEVRRGDAFVAVGERAGRGTTAEATDYAFTTEALAPGRHAFRLRQVDLDGTTHYSAEATALVAPSGAFALSAPAPNPAAGVTRASLVVREAQAVRVDVLDVLGRLVATVFDGAVSPEAPTAVTVDAGGLPAGLYVLRATGERFQTTRALTVTR